MTTLSSWGKYPKIPQTPHPLNWRSEIQSTLVTQQQTNQTTLPFGLGRSYGDSCLAHSNHVLHTIGLNRFITADWQQGRITAEAGVTLEEILNYSIPRGWFLSVTPGTKYVTLGGAVANDVHGKNHHITGSFGNHICRFSLIRSDIGQVECTPSQNIDLFYATIGGLGLTGIIEWVEIQLIPISSNMIDGINIPFGSLSEFFKLSNELDHQYEYTVSWVDCLAKNDSIGRGVFMAGNHAKQGKLKACDQRKFTVPFTAPFPVFNNLTLKLLNSTYYHLNSRKNPKTSVTYDGFFYPLDRILEWNRIYGPKGFQQFQCVIPNINAEDGIKALLQAIVKAKVGSFLAVLKCCGNIPSKGLMSFPIEGISLAMDFANHCAINEKIFNQLDQIVLEAGGKMYLAKDAHLSPSTLRAFYPNWERLEAIRDPALCSYLWTRFLTE